MNGITFKNLDELLIMKHGSLFSGIGGFDLAAQWAGWANIFQCEIDKFCRQVKTIEGLKPDRNYNTHILSRNTATRQKLNRRHM